MSCNLKLFSKLYSSLIFSDQPGPTIITSNSFWIDFRISALLFSNSPTNKNELFIFFSIGVMK